MDPADARTSVSESSPYAPYPDDRSERQSRWRIVFGSLSLVVGVMGFCMQGIGAAMVVFGDRASAASGFTVPSAPPTVLWLTVVQFGLLTVLGVMLIVGAAMLLRRDPRGRALILSWVVARLLMVVLGLGAAVLTLKPQVEWQIEIVASVREQMRKDPAIREDQLPPIPDRAEAETQALRGIGIASIFFATWPFVMAIVLTRPFVKAEVDSWRRPANNPL